MKSIVNRRTIRKYTDEPISDDVLNDLLRMASRASTMGNLQLYSVIVTRNVKMKEKLSPLHFNQPMVKGAPVVLTFCADYRRVTDWCHVRNAHPGYDNFLSFLNAASDVLLFTQNFCTLAEEKGLGICYLGTTIYNADAIIEVLELPELVVPIATITVGYPDECPSQPERLPLEAIVHHETYHCFDHAEIDAIYKDKESTSDNRHFVEINQVETLAQIFTDIRYKKSDCEAISKSLLNTLKKQKFL